ncbi:MAG TPA: glycosyltransferase family 4 protein, partial [Bacteroidia bacterium]|nr:glycosyltransferase family 4 protein [Bacteroidia bacterium]
GELDIFVNVSRKESFGVSVLEAQACQIPVITSSIAGLREVSRPGISGLEVSPDHPPELAKALEILVTDAALRKKMGEAGRAFVAATYNWDDNVRRMEQIYESLSA